MLFFVYAVPVLSLAFVVWTLVAPGLPDGVRHASMVATILLACGVWTLVRVDGITGNNAAEMSWRWAETAEQRLLAATADGGLNPRAGRKTSAGLAEWPGFRGPERDGVVAGVRLETDWSASPPVELWRRPIGPGWSSFAVSGDLLYTQEQRGEHEVVATYDITTGEPVWRHQDTARFWEAHAGPGPRGTPTLSGDHVFTFGATGILNVLDADDGAVGGLAMPSLMWMPSFRRGAWLARRLWSMTS